MLTLEQFQAQNFPLNAQEKRLLKSCVVGDLCVISQPRPEKAIKRGKNSNVIRMEFIRWLTLGGDSQYPLHAHGVRLMGAWLEGVLDLYGATVRSDLVFLSSHITQAPNFRNMRLDGSLILSGSILPEGLGADGAEIMGDVFLRARYQHQFESRGEIRLLGTTIGGDLDCSGAQLDGFDGKEALIIDRAEIAGGGIFKGRRSIPF